MHFEFHLAVTDSTKKSIEPSGPPQAEHVYSIYTVCGQNTIGIYITPLVLIQPTDVEQNAVNNNWLLELQPAVKLQNWQKSYFHQIE